MGCLLRCYLAVQRGHGRSFFFPWEILKNNFRGLAPVKVIAGLDKGCVWSGHIGIGIGCGVGGEDASAGRMGRAWRWVMTCFIVVQAQNLNWELAIS